VGFKTTFRAVADDVHLGGTLGRYAVGDLKGKSIVTIDDRNCLRAGGVAEEFAKAVKASGRQRSRTSSSRPTRATDFTAILTAVKAKKPDIIFYGGMDAVAGPMIRSDEATPASAPSSWAATASARAKLPKLGGAMPMARSSAPKRAARGAEGRHGCSGRLQEEFGADVQIYAP
jgi:branched-chain amino acid transport system substrate-binding protein